MRSIRYIILGFFLTLQIACTGGFQSNSSNINSVVQLNSEGSNELADEFNLEDEQLSDEVEPGETSLIETPVESEIDPPSNSVPTEDNTPDVPMNTPPKSLFVLECVPLASNLFMRVENEFYGDGKTTFRRIYYSTPEVANACVGNSELALNVITKELYSIEEHADLELESPFEFDKVIETSNFNTSVIVKALSFDGLVHLNQNLDQDTLKPCSTVSSGLVPEPATELKAFNPDAYYSEIGKPYVQTCRGQDIYQIMLITGEEPRVLKTGMCSGPSCYTSPENRPTELWPEQYWQKHVVSGDTLRTLNIVSYNNDGEVEVLESTPHISGMNAISACQEFHDNELVLGRQCYWNGHEFGRRSGRKPLFVVSQDVTVLYGEPNNPNTGFGVSYGDVELVAGPLYLAKNTAQAKCEAVIDSLDAVTDDYYCKWGEEILAYEGHIELALKFTNKCNRSVFGGLDAGEVACFSFHSIGLKKIDMYPYHYQPAGQTFSNYICKSREATATKDISISGATTEQISFVADSLGLPETLVRNNIRRLIEYTCD